MKYRIIGLIGLLLGLMAGGAGPVWGAEASTGIFFPVVPLESSSDRVTEWVPMAINQPLAADSADVQSDVKRALIVIHDFSRDAKRALADMMALAGMDNTDTLIIAPQFLLASDIARLAKTLPDQGEHCARWPLGAWSLGGDSIVLPGQQPVSSFVVIDGLLLYLADARRFPQLKSIALAGHGEGADFVQRYAAVGRAPDAVEAQGVSMGFVVANASSYAYVTALRFRGGKHGFGLPDTGLCPDYNRWPYGLDNLVPYVRRVGSAAIKQNYPLRHITYLAGADMAGNNRDPAPDAGCAASLQGGNRAARLDNFSLYLDVVFGDEARRTQPVAMVPKTGYDAKAVWGSPCGIAALFGNGTCQDQR